MKNLLKSQKTVPIQQEMYWITQIIKIIVNSWV